MEKSYRSVSYFFIAFLLFAFMAFFKTYFGLVPQFNDRITFVTHYHAFTVVLWLAMLIVQPILIRNKYLDWHRFIGKASYALVPLVLLGMLLIINQMQTREKNLAVFAANLVDIPQFVILYGLAIFHRKNTPYHLRFMLMSVVAFIAPICARIPTDSFLIIGLLYVGLLVFEYFTGKKYKPYLIGIAIYVINLAIAVYLFLGNQPLLDTIWGLFWKN